MKTIDEKYMALALKEAKKALLFDEVPVGCIIVKDNKIIARAYNKRETTNDPTSHAEINAIRKASKKLKSWRLVGSTIYVTLEPCSMCAGAILWSRIDRVVYGANDFKGGALGSTYNMYEIKNLNHYPKITSGVLSNQCSEIISSYFKSKRK